MKQIKLYSTILLVFPLLFLHLIKNLVLVIPNTWDGMMDSLNRKLEKIQEGDHG